MALLSHCIRSTKLRTSLSSTRNCQHLLKLCKVIGMIFFYITFAFFLSQLYLPILMNSVENETFDACSYDLAAENLKNFESRAFVKIEQSKPQKFVLKFCRLQEKDALLEYLGLHFEISKKADYFSNVWLSAVTKQATVVNSENAKQNVQMPLANCDISTMQQFQSEPIQLKSFKLQMDISLNNLINEICRDISTKEITLSIKQILLLFSEEKQK